MAVARALAAEPALLLLDEPMAALDAPVAAAIRQTLKHVLAERSAILVTHDILDAALLADCIAVMDRGRIVEIGPTEQILHRPRTLFAAQLWGSTSSTVSRCARTRSPPQKDTRSSVSPRPLDAWKPDRGHVRPATVSVHRRAPEAACATSFQAGSRQSRRRHLVRIHVGPLAADVTPETLRALQLDVGDPVFVAFKAAGWRCIRRSSAARLITRGPRACGPITGRA